MLPDHAGLTRQTCSSPAQSERIRTIKQRCCFASHGKLGNILLCERRSGVCKESIDGIISLHFLLRTNLREAHRASVWITERFRDMCTCIPTLLNCRSSSGHGASIRVSAVIPSGDEEREPPAIDQNLSRIYADQKPFTRSHCSTTSTPSRFEILQIL